MTFLIIFENYLILNNFENDFSHHIRELPTSQQLREWLFSSYARNVSSNCLPQTRHNHIGCIYLIFLQCAFSNVSLTRLPERMRNHTGCICLTFLHCVFSYVSSNCLHEKMHNHTGCICLIFPFVHWQLLRWVSSPGIYHDHGFVPSPQAGKVCPLLLLVLNWENLIWNFWEKENESEINCSNNGDSIDSTASLLDPKRSLRK